MPKGQGLWRTAENQSQWFSHHTIVKNSNLERDLNTTTGVMLQAPFGALGKVYPPGPPAPYSEKMNRNFKASNNFSLHDNRHSFQDKGIYFGDGKNTRTLGKRLTSPRSRQHSSGSDFLTHYGREVINFDYNPTYSSNFAGVRSADPIVKHRRFPTSYKPAEDAVKPTDADNPLLCGAQNHTVPLAVLAVTQEPFLPSNKFKYSYNGMSKCYPRCNHESSKSIFFSCSKHGRTSPHVQY